jgi:cytochrome c oxidase assembly factor CtaG
VTAGVSAGYQGPAELTLARAFTSWTADLPVLAVTLVAAGLYLAGVRRLRRSGEPWPAGAVLAFGGGLAVLAVATMSFLGVYQGVLFYARAVQTILLLLAAPLFLALGRPLSLLTAAAPRAGRRLAAVVSSRPARVLTFPAVTALAVVLVGFLLYFTPWYEAGLHSATARELTYLALLAPGWVFFWTLLRVDPVPQAYPYLVALWVTGAEVVGDAVLGLAVLADQHLIAGGYYQALARPWGPGPRADQVIGGGALWILGDLIGLPFLAAQLIAMMREDETQARAEDAELDAVVMATGGAEPERPWWESDSRFGRRFRPPPGQ